jgi:hypothetical protein
MEQKPSRNWYKIKILKNELKSLPSLYNFSQKRKLDVTIKEAIQLTAIREKWSLKKISKIILKITERTFEKTILKEVGMAPNNFLKLFNFSNHWTTYIEGLYQTQWHSLCQWFSDHYIKVFKLYRKRILRTLADHKIPVVFYSILSFSTIK